MKSTERWNNPAGLSAGILCLHSIENEPTSAALDNYGKELAGELQAQYAGIYFLQFMCMDIK